MRDVYALVLKGLGKMDRRKFLGFSSAALGTTVAASATGFTPLKKNFHDPELGESFELFIHPSVVKNEQQEGRIGCSAAIYLSSSKNWIKKQFNPWKPAANGTLPEMQFSENPQNIFEKEMRSYQTLSKLGSKTIPGNMSFDKKSLTITMPYMGEDLQIQRRLFRKKAFRKEFINFLVTSFEDYQKLVLLSFQRPFQIIITMLIQILSMDLILNVPQRELQRT